MNELMRLGLRISSNVLQRHLNEPAAGVQDVRVLGRDPKETDRPDHTGRRRRSQDELGRPCKILGRSDRDRTSDRSPFQRCFSKLECE